MQRMGPEDEELGWPLGIFANAAVIDELDLVRSVTAVCLFGCCDGEFARAAGSGVRFA